MNESTKWHQKRIDNGDYDNYINGEIIDIGCGPDPIQSPNGNTKSWDVLDGDAQYLATIADNTFDCVYSSHSLEHMVDIDIALSNWIRVTRPGRYLYIVIPDFYLYEKGQWPSRYNGDHKHSFSMDKTREDVGRQNHFNIFVDLFPIFRKYNCSIKIVKLEDFNFNYEAFEADQTMGYAESQILIVAKKGE